MSYCDQSASVITKGTESPTFGELELGKAPLAIKVFGQNFLHEGKSIGLIINRLLTHALSFWVSWGPQSLPNLLVFRQP